MKKIIFLLFILISFLLKGIGQKAYTEQSVWVDDARCIFVNYNLGAKIIILGCDNYKYLPSNIQVNRTCMSTSENCYLTAEVYVNGEKVSGEEKRINGKSKVNIPINYNSIAKNIGFDYLGKEIPLKVEITTHCGVRGGNLISTIKLDPIMIKVLKEGDTYIATEYIGTDQNVICGWGKEGDIYKSKEDMNKARICCKNAVTLNAKITKNEKNIVEYIGDISGGIENKAFNFNFVIKPKYKISNTFHSKFITHNFKPKANTCICPGLVEYFNKWEVWEYKVICGAADEKCVLKDAYLELFDVHFKAWEESTSCELSK